MNNQPPIQKLLRLARENEVLRTRHAIAAWLGDKGLIELALGVLSGEYSNEKEIENPEEHKA